MTVYTLFCGNFDCNSRIADPPVLHEVDGDDIEPGERWDPARQMWIWLCLDCRERGVWVTVKEEETA